MGAVSGVISGGIGQVFGEFGSLGLMGEIGRAYTHGFAQGMMSEVTGGGFMTGFASGGLSSLATSGFQAVGGNFANSMGGGTAFGAVAGGIGAELTGGDFWRGAATGATVALLNHYGEELQERWGQNRASRKAGKAYAEAAVNGMSLAKANSSGGGLSNSYYLGLGANGGLLSAKALYNVINAEYVSQVKFNNSLLPPRKAPYSVSSLKTPKGLRIFGKIW